MNDISHVTVHKSEAVSVIGSDGREWLITANGRYLYRTYNEATRPVHVKQDWESWPFNISPVDLFCEAGAAMWEGVPVVWGVATGEAALSVTYADELRDELEAVRTTVGK